MTVALRFAESGQGVPVVLLHAFPLSSAMWAPQRTGLESRCRVIAPDQRGFGETPLGGDPASLGRPSLDIAADDVVKLLDRLGLDTVVLGGLSMGGYVAMALLRRHPERVRALVLADTKAGADPEPAAENRRRIASAVEAAGSSELLLDEVFPKLLGATTIEKRPEVVEMVRGAVAHASPAGVAWAQRAMAARPDSFDTLRAARVPALVLVGEEDQFTTVADAEALAEALPDSDLIRLPGVGHLSAVEDPAAFNDAVGAFVDKLPG
jgi:pimeloyl-ACP methyl ester carboxylesterase